MLGYEDQANGGMALALVFDQSPPGGSDHATQHALDAAFGETSPVYISFTQWMEKAVNHLQYTEEEAVHHWQVKMYDDNQPKRRRAHDNVVEIEEFHTSPIIPVESQSQVLE